MTKKEQKTYLKSFQDYKKSVLSSRESACRFMKESGIINNSGKLTSNYK